jgi:hypothetical protein
VADPTQGDPWADKPLRAFCVLVGQDYECLKAYSRKNWPRQLQRWAASWEVIRESESDSTYAPTPQEAFQCIQGITQSEHASGNGRHDAARGVEERALYIDEGDNPTGIICLTPEQEAEYVIAYQEGRGDEYLATVPSL